VIRKRGSGLHRGHPRQGQGPRGRRRHPGCAVRAGAGPRRQVPRVLDARIRRGEPPLRTGERYRPRPGAAEQVHEPDCARGWPLSASAVREVHTVLSGAFKQAVVWGWAGHNPAKLATPPGAGKAGVSPPAGGDVARLLKTAMEQDPKELVDEVDPDVLRAKMREEAKDFSPAMLTWIKLDSPWAQRYAVTTLCRVLYTLETGRVASKRASLLWARDNLDPRWQELVSEALEGVPLVGTTPTRWNPRFSKRPWHLTNTPSNEPRGRSLDREADRASPWGKMPPMRGGAADATGRAMLVARRR
jgi:Domain of unknown function (DUF4111)